MPVSKATIDIPRIGVWHADLLVDSLVSFTGTALIQFGSKTLYGTFARNGPDINKKLRARVLGGAGRLSSLLPAKGFRLVPLRIPLTDTLKSCGEVLSPISDPQILNIVLDTWIRLQMTGSQAIDAILQAVTTTVPSWRMLLDGTLWVGYEYWGKSSTVDAVPLYSEPERGNITFYSIDPIILPGQTLAYSVPGVGLVSKKVSYVRHWLTPRRMHTTVYYEDN